MIRFILIVVIAGLCVFPAVARAAEGAAPPRFFSSMQDVPLVSGLAELDDQTVTFDKPEGRIVESVAEIESGSFDSVKKTYEKILPQFGWRPVAENSYAREDEILHLNFESYDDRNFLRVLVRPRDGVSN